MKENQDMKNRNTIFTTILLVLVCFAISPMVQAVVPAPDGGYPGGNTAEGQNALFSRTTGGFNTAVGLLSLRSLTTGSFNTGVGAGTLLANTADQNTATGVGALLSNTTGAFNTANGVFALFSNTEGADNTAIGTSALQNNTTGNFNAANGVNALFSNTTGVDNTAIGTSALQNNILGHDNTANGFHALINNTTGNGNTANGVDALVNNAIGSGNTAIGAGALNSNTTGNNNTALGVGAGNAVTSASNVIAILSSGANIDNSCFIGNIFGATVAIGASQVMVDSTGKLGTAMSSSRRFKKEIKPMDKTSEALLALKPVTFHYKTDNTSTPQFGLIAEEVAEVNPDLVIRDKNGEIYTVRYDAVNAMLLNEFLKEHRRVQELQGTVAELKSSVANQEAIIARQQTGLEAVLTRLGEQASQIRKVSAQAAMSRSTPEIAESNP